MIYLWVFLVGIAGVVYGYVQYRRHGARGGLMLLLLGFFAIAYVIWGLITRSLIISNTGNTSVLLWSRKALALVALVVGLILLWRQYVGQTKKD